MADYEKMLNNTVYFLDIVRKHANFAFTEILKAVASEY